MRPLLAVTLLAVVIACPGLAGPINELDADGDGVLDFLDVCTLDPLSPVPCGDTDADGYGNPCDGDLDNDGVVNAADIPSFVGDLNVGTDSGIGSDLNCDGVVNAADIPPFVDQLQQGVPGPSGLVCAGTVPCP